MIHTIVIAGKIAQVLGNKSKLNKVHLKNPEEQLNHQKHQKQHTSHIQKGEVSTRTTTKTIVCLDTIYQYCIFKICYIFSVCQLNET
jgi:hypothetical protein